MSFVATTYNVLAAAYAYPRYYPRTPPEILDPVARRAALARYVATLPTDILCMQEVEPDSFADMHAATADIFDATFRQKGHDKPDGCGTLYGRKNVELIGQSDFAYDDAPAGEQSSGHIAQIMVFRIDGAVLAVANTHLKWDAPETPREAQWGLRQMKQLLAHRPHVVPTPRAWIVCGDFNVAPDSAVVELLLDAGFRCTHAEMRAPSCVANNQARMIDYLFYSGPLAAAPLPIRALTDDTVLPSATEPSDHVPVSSRFEWTEESVL